MILDVLLPTGKFWTPDNYLCEVGYLFYLFFVWFLVRIVGPSVKLPRFVCVCVCVYVGYVRKESNDRPFFYTQTIQKLHSHSSLLSNN